MGFPPYVLPMLAISASLVGHEMVTYSLFSYNGFMITHLGVVDDKDKAGYYAGILTSSLMIGRTVTSFFWGWFADRYGRRKVILIGQSSSIALSVAFGFSWTYWWAVLIRLFIGTLNGSAAVAKALVSDICGKEHEILGMGFLTTAVSLGLIMGPGLAAVLVEPATHFPSLFSESGIFGRFPFLLPNLTVAGFNLLTLPLVLLFVPGYKRSSAANKRKCNAPFEDLRLTNLDAGIPIQQWSESPTLELGYRQPRYGSPDGSERADTPGARIAARASAALTPSSPRVPSWASRHETLPPTSGSIKEGGTLSPKSREPASLLKQSNVRVLLVIYTIFSILFMGFDDVYPLWALSTVASGGLNWTSQRIGQVLLAAGVAVLFFEVVAVRCITARNGIKVSQRVGSLVEVPAYVIFPMLASLHGTNLLNLASVILLFTVFACSNSLYIAIALAINNSTDASRRGEVNGLAMTIGSIGKAVAPAACSALFAFSIDGDRPFPFDVHLVWYTAAVLRFVVGLLGWNTIRDDGGHEENPEVQLNEIGFTGIDESETSSEAVAIHHNRNQEGRDRGEKGGSERKGGRAGDRGSLDLFRTQ